MRVTLPFPPYTYKDLIKRDVKSLAREFEAIMLKEVLKVAFRPTLEGKSFQHRIYFDMFIDSVSRKLAEGGGIGLADYILRSLRGRKELEKIQDLKSLVSELVSSYGLPSWVSYIPEVESGYDPSAVSPKGAAGLWQLMPETARRFGLKVSEDLDERFDPLKSTHAALRYIRYLFDRFKRWDLVLVAYNWGEGNAKKLVNLNIWENLDLLPEETRRYLERFRPFLPGI